MLTNRGTITPMNPPREFNLDFAAWRKTRPQYAAMLAGIRAERPFSELVKLAAAAGLANVTDLNALIELRVRAVGHQAEAKQLAAAQAAAKKVDAEWLSLDAQLDKAATRGEEDRLECLMLNLADVRQKAHQKLTDAEYSHNIVSTAKSEGVL